MGGLLNLRSTPHDGQINMGMSDLVTWGFPVSIFSAIKTYIVSQHFFMVLWTNIMHVSVCPLL